MSIMLREVLLVVIVSYSDQFMLYWKDIKTPLRLFGEIGIYGQLNA